MYMKKQNKRKKCKTKNSSKAERHGLNKNNNVYVCFRKLINFGQSIDA